MTSRSRWPRSPSAISAKPNRIANSSTCRMSPRASAPTTLSGMMLRTKSTDFPGILNMRNARHDGAEDDRRDHHLDQFDEAVAERLDPVIGRECGRQPAHRL